MTTKVLITKLNNISESEFTNLFKNVVEYYPNITEYLVKRRPYKNASEFVSGALNFLNDLNEEDKENILKLHPDLAGKLADEGKLTSESKNEQKAAGLDVITGEEKQNIFDLNKQYKDKFGFPFVICARENNFTSITTMMKKRLANTKEEEVKIGFEEVTKITKLRLMDLVTE